MLLESDFQSRLIEEIKERYPGAIVLKNDPAYILGIPDLTILYERNWAVLDPKRSIRARRGPNQAHYISLLNEMSYASFVYPENKKEVMRELQRTLESNW